jgi:hypothetical protein
MQSNPLIPCTNYGECDASLTLRGPKTSQRHP